MPETDLTDAKIAAAEARTDAKFERLMGRIDTIAADLRGDLKEMNAKLDGINTLVSSTKANIWVATGAIVAAIALAFAIALVVGPWAFGFGAQLRDMVRER